MGGVPVRKVAGRGEKVVPEAAGDGFAPHIGGAFVEFAMAAGAEGGDGFGGTASVDDGAVEGSVPVEVVGAEGADAADDAGVRVLKDGGEAGDARLCDGLKNYGGVGETGLGGGRRRCRWGFGRSRSGWS